MAVLTGRANLTPAEIPSLFSKNQETSKSFDFSRIHVSIVVKARAMASTWSSGSWKSMKVLQIPTYLEHAKLESVLKNLETYPPLVFTGEVRNLEEKLGEAAMGRAFRLPGGACAKSFKEFKANNIRDPFRILLEMELC